MLHSDDSLSDVIESARTALARRDKALADADKDLNIALREAGRVAVVAAQRLDAVRAEIDAAVLTQAVGAPLEGRRFARFLLTSQQLITDIVTQSKSEVEAKTAVLQQLRFHYQLGE
jgi:hypothetical protein